MFDINYRFWNSEKETDTQGRSLLPINGRSDHDLPDRDLCLCKDLCLRPRIHLDAAVALACSVSRVAFVGSHLGDANARLHLLHESAALGVPHLLDNLDDHVRTREFYVVVPTLVAGCGKEE